MHFHLGLFHYFVIGGWTPQITSIVLGCSSVQHIIILPILFRECVIHYNDTTIIEFVWKRLICMSKLVWTVIVVIRNLIHYPASKLWKSGECRKWQYIRHYSYNKKFKTKFNNFGVMMIGKGCSILSNQWKINNWI